MCLIKKKIIINFKHRNDNTFLYCAIENANKEIIKLFLNKEKIKSKKLLDYICFNRPEILSLLEILNLKIQIFNENIIKKQI